MNWLHLYTQMQRFIRIYGTFWEIWRRLQRKITQVHERKKRNVHIFILFNLLIGYLTKQIYVTWNSQYIFLKKQWNNGSYIPTHNCTQLKSICNCSANVRLSSESWWWRKKNIRENHPSAWIWPSERSW